MLHARARTHPFAKMRVIYNKIKEKSIMLLFIIKFILLVRLYVYYLFLSTDINNNISKKKNDKILSTEFKILKI